MVLFLSDPLVTEGRICSVMLPRSSICGETAIDKHAAELATGEFLLLQRRLQLLFGEQPLLNQQITKADFLRGGGIPSSKKP